MEWGRRVGGGDPLVWNVEHAVLGPWNTLRETNMVLRETNIYIGRWGCKVLLDSDAVYSQIPFYTTKIQGP